MKHNITILTLSRKWGGKCVAGYDYNDNRLVRLVSNAQGKELAPPLITGINLLDEVEVEIIRPCPYEHQTENVLVLPNSYLTVTGRSNVIEDFDSLVCSGGNIFGNTQYKIVDATNLSHSIELVQFYDMSIYIEDGKAKADFWVDGKFHRWYRITDIAHEVKEETIESGYAIITLPPSDDFAQNRGYYKYVAAIYPT